VRSVAEQNLIKLLIAECQKLAPSIRFEYRYYDQSNRLLPEPILWRIVVDLAEYARSKELPTLINRVNDLLTQHNKIPVSADEASSGGVTSPATGKPPSPKKRSPPESGK